MGKFKVFPINYYLKKLSCCSILLYWDCLFIAELWRLNFSMVQQFLSRLVRIRSRRFLYFWSIKIFLPFKLLTAHPQEKSKHKKNHAYLSDLQDSPCLLKKYSRLQHFSQSRRLQTCKMSESFIVYRLL